MNKILLIIVFFSHFVYTFAQPDSIFSQKIDSLRKANNISQIIKIIHTESISDTHQLWYTYQLACFYSLDEQFEKAFFYLNKAIDFGAKGEDILSDTDFESLYDKKEWVQLNEKLDEIFLIQHPSVINKKLAIKLWRIGIEDQQFRTLRKNYKKEIPKRSTEEYKVFQDKINQQWIKRTKGVYEIIKKYGWPGYNLVDTIGSQAAFYVMQHSGRKMMKKAFRELKKAVKQGDASLIHYAMMLDRIRVTPRFSMFKKKQIYGTQVYGRSKIGEPVIKYQLDPIIKPEEVNKRRASVGLGPIQEYVKKWNIEFNVPQK